MKNENIEEVETSENNELEESNVEETNEGQEDTNEETSNSPTLEDFEKAQAKLKELEEKNKQLYARLKKGEPKSKETNENYLTRDEGILLAKGYSDDEITQLKRIAGDDSLLKAVNDPLFISYRQVQEQKDKSKKAQLEASAVRGTKSSQKAVSDMTADEHREYHRKLLNS